MKDITKAEMRKKLGNITQLQELLFGEQAEEINQKLTRYNQRQDRLEADFHKLQLLIDDSLDQLENKLLHKINLVANSLEKQIKYLTITTKQEQQDTQQELDRLAHNTQENLDLIRNGLKAQSHNLRTEITQSKIALDRDLQLLKQQITTKLESQLNELSGNKVSRGDLAEVLFELCLKLREPEVHFELPESLESSEPLDLMLPEEKVTSDNGQLKIEH